MFKTLPAVALAMTLGACGGDGGDDSVNPPTGGSITACFTAAKTVNFAFVSSNTPSGLFFPNRSTTGPMTYKGQAVTGQTSFYPNGAAISSRTSYWTVTGSGVQNIAEVLSDGTVAPDDSFLPQNMRPGQTVTSSDKLSSYTFVGFETISLAGKTFSNACHIILDGSEQWYAPGYALVKQVNPDRSSTQYNGDL